MVDAAVVAAAGDAAAAAAVGFGAVLVVVAAVVLGGGLVDDAAGVAVAGGACGQAGQGRAWHGRLVEVGMGSGMLGDSGAACVDVVAAGVACGV